MADQIDQFLSSGGQTSILVPSQQPSSSADPVDDWLSSGGKTDFAPAKTTPVDPNESVRELVAHEVTQMGASIPAGFRSIYDLVTGKSLAETDQRYKDFVREHSYQPQDETTQALTKTYEKASGSAANPLTWPNRVADAAADVIAHPSNIVAASPFNLPSNLPGAMKPETGGTVAPVISGALQFGSSAAPLISGLRGAPASISPEAQATADSLRKAQDLGYVVPPSTSNPTMANRVMEGFAGKASTAQAASIKNQAITNSLVRQELGLEADAPLTHETMDSVRAQASPAYEAVKAIPEIQFGPEYEKELSALAGTSDKLAKTLPNYRGAGAQQVNDLIESLKPMGGKMDGEVAVELSKSLRSEASGLESSAARTGSPSDRMLARAYRGASEAVENAVERHLESIDQGDLADQWDAARRQIAKSYSVQNALDGAGNVDAGKLAKQLLKGKPLSGNLEAAADFANAFPKAAKVVKESMPGMSPLDVYGGAAIEAVTGNPSALLVGPARMATRAALLSPVGQKLAVPSLGYRPPQVLNPSAVAPALSTLAETQESLK